MNRRTFGSVIVGDSGVGKSTLVIRFATQEYPQEGCSPSVMDAITANIGHPFRSEYIAVGLWDTPSCKDHVTERYRIGKWYEKADVFLLCFAIDQLNSYESIRSYWAPEIRNYSSEALILVVGMKIDLRESERTFETRNKHYLTPEEGQQLANDIRAVKYVECSSLTQHGLKLVFDEAASIVFSPPKPINHSTKSAKKFFRSLIG